MAHKKSKLLQALDEVLDSDELDVIQAEIEDDMEADKDEQENEEDEAGGFDFSDEDDEDPNTSSTVLQSDPIPLAAIVPAKRKRKNKSNSCVSREFCILCKTAYLWDLIVVNSIPRTHFSNYVFAFDPQRSTGEAVQNQTRTYRRNSRTRIFRTI
jgi:hypothetical protein